MRLNTINIAASRLLLFIHILCRAPLYPACAFPALAHLQAHKSLRLHRQQVVCKKKDIHTRSWVPANCSLVTFVALGKDGRPTPVAPLALDDSANDDEAARERRMEQQTAKRKELALEWDAAQQRVHEAAAAGRLGAALCTEEYCKEKTERLRVRDTAVQLQKTWMPRNQNIGGTIFGGDLIAWMESAALFCATSFTRNNNMVTVNMDRIFFFESIMVTDLLKLEAHTVYATAHTVQVEVVVTVEKGGLLHDNPMGADGLKTSHRGHFTVLNLDEVGRKRPVTMGFDLENASMEELIMFEQAKERHRFFTARDRRVEVAGMLAE